MDQEFDIMDKEFANMDQEFDKIIWGNVLTESPIVNLALVVLCCIGNEIKQKNELQESKKVKIK